MSPVGRWMPALPPFPSSYSSAYRAGRTHFYSRGDYHAAEGPVFFAARTLPRDHLRGDVYCLVGADRYPRDSQRGRHGPFWGDLILWACSTAVGDIRFFVGIRRRGRGGSGKRSPNASPAAHDPS